MSEESSEKSALVPRLRFPEFQDSEEWKAKSLASVCNVLQGYGFPESLQGRTEGRYPFCKVSDISRAVAENGGLLAKAANYVGDSDLLELRAKLIPIGTTVFAKIGEALRLNRRAFVQHECLIDNNAVGLKGVEGIADDYFIHLLSQLIDLNEHCGGAVPSVNKSTLEAIKVIVPDLDEQQKIADCLSSLDELITAETQKLGALKTHKKGLMQQLFPREGETVPRLRFPEFRGAGEWGDRSLESVSNGISSGKDQNDPDGLYDLYGSTGVIGKTSTASYRGEFLLVARVGANAGLLNKSGGEFGVTDNTLVIRLNDSVNLNFVFYYLDDLSLNKLIFGSGQPLITGGQLKALSLYFPSETEQQKIADCLSSLDNLITTQSQKIDTLKTHKKGLMQQLFPVLDEVPA